MPLSTLVPVQQPAADAAAAVSAIAALSAEVKALELRVAEGTAEAKILLARITGAPAEADMSPRERIEHQRLEQTYRTLSTEIATNQARLELLKVRLAQATDAAAAAQHGAIVLPGGTLVAPTPPVPPAVDRDGPILGIIVIALVFAPMAFAIAWRLIRRSAPVAGVRELAESNARMQRLEQSVEAIAIEIERMSENQRFLTRALTETPLAIPREHPTPV
jgi:small-conductance mechanosensitive channel